MKITPIHFGAVTRLVGKEKRDAAAADKNTATWYFEGGDINFEDHQVKQTLGGAQYGFTEPEKTIFEKLVAEESEPVKYLDTNDFMHGKNTYATDLKNRTEMRIFKRSKGIEQLKDLLRKAYHAKK